MALEGEIHGVDVDFPHADILFRLIAEIAVKIADRRFVADIVEKLLFQGHPLFEGCPADDTCVEPYMVQTAIKRGPMLRHIDARMITNPRYQRYALDLAEQLGIPVQDAVRSAGSTNGAAIHLAGKAVPVIVIGIPVRYAHTHYGISAYADFENAVKLACEILKRLDEEQIMRF